MDDSKMAIAIELLNDIRTWLLLCMESTSFGLIEYRVAKKIVAEIDDLIGAREEDPE